MQATIKHTTHASLRPGETVEVIGYVARATAVFGSALPNVKPKEETRDIFFELGDLEFPENAPHFEIPVSTPDQPIKTPTPAPQSKEAGYLADILGVMRDTHEILAEIYQILNEHVRKHP